MKPLSFINLAGVLALAVLCAAQWQGNRQLNHEINRLESIRIAQDEQLQRRDTAIAGHLEDIETLKAKVLQLTDTLRTTEGELRAEKQKTAQLASEREQLRKSVTEWAAAVEARDERIAENQSQIQELAQLQSEAVTRYNTLAKDYNEAVKLLNERTAAYSELVNRWNELAEANGTSR